MNAALEDALPSPVRSGLPCGVLHQLNDAVLDALPNGCDREPVHVAMLIPAIIVPGSETDLLIIANVNRSPHAS